MWRKLVGIAVLLAVVGAVALLVPVPDAEQIRVWAQSTGPWLPIVFFVAHALATVVVPRVPFTLSAGLLFGPTTGIAVAVAATAASAALAFGLARLIGRDAVAARLTHPALAAVERRLAYRGWLAVASLRLISPLPFSLVSFGAGLSAVRLVPYLIATVVGVLPGTVALVVLGGALSGESDPALLVVSSLAIVVGVVGLVVDVKTGVPERRR